MFKITDEQLEKIYELAGFQKPEDLTLKNFSEALVSIENKIITSTSYSPKNNNQDKLNILIVDDLELTIHQLSLLLSKTGFNTSVARTEGGALQAVKIQSFDFIVLDLFIPDSLNGLEVLKQIKNSEKNKDAKVIIISATDDNTLIDRCFASGADEFVRKSPSWHKDILNLINQSNDKKDNLNKFLTIESKDISKNLAILKTTKLTNHNFLHQLEEEVMILANTGYYNIIINLEEINFNKKELIKSLSQLYKICAKKGGKLALLNASEFIKEQLSYVFLQDAIKSYRDKNEAIQSLG